MPPFTVLVAEPSDKRALYSETGAAAVDTESHIAARIAAEGQVPFAACRVVIDAVDMRLPPAAMVRLRPDGTADVAAVFRSVLKQPGQIPELVRTALDARVARSALYAGRQMLGAGLGFPQFDHRTDAVRDVLMDAVRQDRPASAGP